MKKIILDLRNTTDRETLYDVIAEAFSFPAYFGRNLDALYDCLTEIAEDTCIGLFLPDDGLSFAEQADDGLRELTALDGLDRAFVPEPAEDGAGAEQAFPEYLEKVRRTFEDAEEENPHLCVIYGE